MNHFIHNMTRNEVASSSMLVTFITTFVLLLIVLLSVIAASGQVTDEFPVPPSFATEGIPTIKNADVEHLFFDPSEVRSNLIWDVDRKNRSILVTDEKSYIYRLGSAMGKPQNLIDGRSPNISPSSTIRKMQTTLNCIFGMKMEICASFPHFQARMSLWNHLFGMNLERRSFMRRRITRKKQPDYAATTCQKLPATTLT